MSGQFMYAIPEEFSGPNSVGVYGLFAALKDIQRILPDDAHRAASQPRPRPDLCGSEGTDVCLYVGRSVDGEGFSGKFRSTKKKLRGVAQRQANGALKTFFDAGGAIDARVIEGWERDDETDPAKTLAREDYWMRATMPLFNVTGAEAGSNAIDPATRQRISQTMKNFHSRSQRPTPKTRLSGGGA